jgi:hypothetical protein
MQRRARTSLAVTAVATVATTPPVGTLRGTEANTPGVAPQKSGSTTGASTTLGKKVVKILTGFQPDEVVTVTLHSTPVKVGTFTASPQGVVTVEFTVPEGTPVGDHDLVYDGNKGTYFQESIAIAAAAVAPPSECPNIPTSCRFNGPATWIDGRRSRTNRT